MRILFIIPIVTAMWLSATAAAAAPELPLEGLVRGGEAAVAEAIDGQTMLLDDGREVRLLGLLAPSPPFAAAARDFLSDLARGKRVSLYYDKERSDRYGRALAHMVLSDDRWVQGALLQAGMAQVMTGRMNRAGAEALYAAEDVARRDYLGLWADTKNRPRCAGQIEASEEGFHIVRGLVIDAADVRGVIYINFGADYRSDFTARVERTHRRRFRAARDQAPDWIAEWEENPKVIIGKFVEVRGWVFRENGPMIDLDHPEQIRLVEFGSGQAGPVC